MTNMSIQPLWLTYFIEILLVLEFQLTKTYFGTFSYKAHFRPQISSNGTFALISSVCGIVNARRSISSCFFSRSYVSPSTGLQKIQCHHHSTIGRHQILNTSELLFHKLNHLSAIEIYKTLLTC